MKKLAIYDMDGTIVDSSHRYQTMPCNTRIDLPHWIENCTDEKIAMDQVLPHYRQYEKDLQCDKTTVIIATARTMSQGDANYKYISNVLGDPDYIVHRTKNDTRKGTDLKTSGIMQNLSDIENFDTITIYEDNMAYLQGMTEFFDNLVSSVIPVFVKSNQGY